MSSAAEECASICAASTSILKRRDSRSWKPASDARVGSQILPVGSEYCRERVVVAVRGGDALYIRWGEAPVKNMVDAEIEPVGEECHCVAESRLCVCVLKSGAFYGAYRVA